MGHFGILQDLIVGFLWKEPKVREQRDQGGLVRNKHGNGWIKGLAFMLNSFWSLLLSDLRLCLIIAVCPILLLNSVSNYFSWVMDSLLRVDVCVWRCKCQ